MDACRNPLKYSFYCSVKYVTSQVSREKKTTLVAAQIEEHNCPQARAPPNKDAAFIFRFAASKEIDTLVLAEHELPFVALAPPSYLA